MYSKFYFEIFSEGERENQLFVFMPFSELFDSKFREIIEPAGRSVGFGRVERADKQYAGSEISHKVFDGIANSKTLLFDLSDDPDYRDQINGNVLYELGIANTIRYPEDILLIREQSPDKVPFNIAGLTINKGGDVKWLGKKLKHVLKEQKGFRDKRVGAAAKSLDCFGLWFMHNFGRKPKGEDHFNDKGLPVQLKVALLRLLDLRILWAAIEKNGTEYAYHWTEFGRAVMEYLGIKKEKTEN